MRRTRALVNRPVWSHTVHYTLPPAGPTRSARYVLNSNVFTNIIVFIRVLFFNLPSIVILHSRSFYELHVTAAPNRFRNYDTSGLIIQMTTMTMGGGGGGDDGGGGLFNDRSDVNHDDDGKTTHLLES